MPSAWVQAYLGHAEPGKTRLALDVACGSGRHTRLALTRGYHVTAVDRDVEAVRVFGALPEVQSIAADLEDGSPWPLRGRVFDAVIVTNYLHRPLMHDIVGSVAPDGILIYETFAIGQERFGKPSNPDYLLRPGELIQAVRDKLIPFAYEQVMLDGPRIVQRIAAVGPGHPWLKAPPAKGDA